jgi:hypothetical protein
VLSIFAIGCVLAIAYGATQLKELRLFDQIWLAAFSVPIGLAVIYWGWLVALYLGGIFVISAETGHVITSIVSGTTLLAVMFLTSTSSLPYEQSSVGQSCSRLIQILILVGAIIGGFLVSVFVGLRTTAATASLLAFVPPISFAMPFVLTPLLPRVPRPILILTIAVSSILLTWVCLLGGWKTLQQHSGL